MTRRSARRRGLGVRLWLSLGTATILLCVSRDAAAQSTRRAQPKKAAPCADSTTTRHGVYTPEQAARGRDIYAGSCRSCHTPESHTGAMFNAMWNKRSLAELFSFVRERMPKNDPGTLSDQEYADVIAYVLKMNQMPAGSVELSTDSTALKAIRIVTKTP